MGFMKNIVSFIFIIFSVIGGIQPLCAAAVKTDGSLSFICEIDGEPVENMIVNIYRLSYETDTDNFTLIEDFTNCKVTTRKTASASLNVIAYTLETYAITENIAPLQTVITDSRGIALFNNLSVGMYLVSAEMLAESGYEYVLMPSIIAVSGDGTVTAYAKISKNIAESGSYKNYTMQKIWIDDNDHLRPPYIYIEIYENSNLVNTVKLDESCGWQFSWRGNSASGWRVKERSVPSDYSVLYDTDGSLFAIVNTADGISQITTSNFTPFASESSGSDMTVSEPDSDGEFTQTSLSANVTTAPVLTASDSLPVETPAYTSQVTTDTAVTPVVSKPSVITPGEITAYTPSSKKNHENLPQTGQLWWPVPCLFALGLILIIRGSKMGGR